MIGVSKEELLKLRDEFPVGTVVELVSMNDPFRPDLIRGTLGKVNSSGVDDAGHIHVSWIGRTPDGSVRVISSLAIVPGEDECRPVTVKELWQEFGDIPMDPDTECLEESWRCFKEGTNRETIWHWFETYFNISVADLMYGGTL